MRARAVQAEPLAMARQALAVLAAAGVVATLTLVAQPKVAVVVA